MRTRLFMLGAVLCLLAAACGGHDSTESSTEDGGAPAATDDGATEAATGQFGTMAEPVCGAGDAAGATDQGVTDDAIQVGVLSDAGNTIIPGLLQELFDASEAFVAWCNDAGGIGGRQIELVQRDTKLVEGQQRITEACEEDFFLVGGASGLDGDLAQPRLDCELPQIPAFVNDPEAVDAGLQVVINGQSPDETDVGIYRLVGEAFPAAIEDFGYLTANTQATGTPQEERIPTALEQVGYTTVYTATTPPPPATVDNWRPYLEPAVDDGVASFEFNQTAPQVVAAMGAFGDVGFEPEIMIGNPSLYDGALIEGNDALSTTEMYVGTYASPFELADENAATQQFLDAMDAEVSGWSDDPKSLAVNSWSSWLLFAQAANACGSDLTRDCVLEEAGNVEGFDGGGIQAPVDITDGFPVSAPCTAVLLASPEGFVYEEDLTQPTDGVFNCDEANLVDAPR